MASDARGSGRAAPSRGVPRGPPEWGDVLYESEWTKSRRSDASLFFFAGEEFDVRPGLLRAFAADPSFEVGDYRVLRSACSMSRASPS